VARALRRLRARLSRARRRVHAAHGGRAAGALARARRRDGVAAHGKAETVASRKASQIVLEAFTKELPELLGGSADLTGSNFTNTSHTPPLRFAKDGASPRTPRAGAAATSTTACASSAWRRS
jgi:transketolase